MEGQTVSKLSAYDIVVAIDKSGSMGDPGKSGKSKWEEAHESTKALVREAIKIDTNGVTLVLFSGTNNIVEFENVNDPAKVDQIFTENQPMGGTPTDAVINKYFNQYFADKAAGKNPKPFILGIVTDGAPNDKKATKVAIIEATKKMEKDEEAGISFLQVGDDPGISSFLQDLDDNLVSEGAKFDIVDTKHLDNVDNITHALEAALND